MVLDIGQTYVLFNDGGVFSTTTKGPFDNILATIRENNSTAQMLTFLAKVHKELAALGKAYDKLYAERSRREITPLRRRIAALGAKLGQLQNSQDQTRPQLLATLEACVELVSRLKNALRFHDVSSTAINTQANEVKKTIAALEEKMDNLRSKGLG